jgi:hypothetical protein
VQQLNANLAQKSITISVTEEAKKWILDKTLVDRSYGARPLRRALQRYVEDPLSEALIAGKITERPAFLEVYLDANQLFYRPVSADENITLARSKGERRGLRELKSHIQSNPPFTRFVVEEFLLYETHLSPSGARYEIRERFKLAR